MNVLDTWFDSHSIKNDTLTVEHGKLRIEGPWPSGKPEERKETLEALFFAMHGFEVVHRNEYRSEYIDPRTKRRVKLYCEVKALHIIICRDITKEIL